MLENWRLKTLMIRLNNGQNKVTTQFTKEVMRRPSHPERSVTRPRKIRMEQILEMEWI
jgi:hypothetical protein